MAHLVKFTYQGTWSTIIEDDCPKDEAIGKAVDKFEDLYPGLYIIDTYAEGLVNKKGEADPKICQEMNG